MRRSRKKAQQLERAFDAPDLMALADRATRLDSPQLWEALDTTINNLGRYMTEYRQHRNGDFLGEMMLGAQAVYSMAAEESSRIGEPPSQKPTRQLGSHI